MQHEAPSRVIVENVQPQIDAGKFPIKRTVGEFVAVTADIFTDGHEVLAAALHFREAGAAEWSVAWMSPTGNDRWTANFAVQRQGWYEFKVEGWIDQFATWRRDLVKRVEAGQEVSVDLLEGAQIVRETAAKCGGSDGLWLDSQANAIAGPVAATAVAAALDPILLSIMQRRSDRSRGSFDEKVYRVWAERERARYGAWYELFPRSCADEPGKHGTFADVQKRLPYIAKMGFEVLYLPPIHPIGHAFRKGPNNTLTPAEGDPGSPWAIGADTGGHTATHPELGSISDFDELLAAATKHGIEIAMDIAFQCSPDHPYVKEHPDWFKHRPDGTIKYAENPPKKYQDIYPLDFECSDWQNLWNELLNVVLFWAGRGVGIFRVDNPHTKPFRFWEWLIAEVQKKHPNAIFLAEAFTRPKVMKYLAKSGFTQSYSYFTWRNNKQELTEYFTELTQTVVGEYMRPNLFANTPDILPEFLQHNGPSGYQIRLILAATLGASYGIYGPVFERFESTPRPRSEEYIDSEKYQVHHWDWDKPNVFCELIGLVNAIRRENPALHFNDRLKFYQTDNDNIICYSKSTADLSNVILVVASLDPHQTQSGTVRLPLEEFGLSASESYQLHDLLTGSRFVWQGGANYVSLDPHIAASHILRLKRKARTEHDFDYFV